MLADVLLAIQVLASLVAAVYVALQVREMRITQQTTLEVERRKQSQAFIARFNSSEMIQLRGEAVEALEGDRYETEKHKVLAYLNFFDEMALAILTGLANEEICRQYFRRILLNTCGGFGVAFADNAEGYASLQKLWSIWRDSSVQPLSPLPSEKKKAEKADKSISIH